jgi:hypothetical protein
MRRPPGIGPERAPTRAAELYSTGQGQLRVLRAKPSPVSNAVAPHDEFSVMLAFVEQLAQFAADLWLEGRLDDFATIEDPPDHDD